MCTYEKSHIHTTHGVIYYAKTGVSHGSDSSLHWGGHMRQTGTVRYANELMYGFYGWNRCISLHFRVMRFSQMMSCQMLLMWISLKPSHSIHQRWWTRLKWLWLNLLQIHHVEWKFTAITTPSFNNSQLSLLLVTANRWALHIRYHNVNLPVTFIINLLV